MHDADRTEFWFKVFEWMEILSPLAWPVIALLILLVMSSCGHAAECQHSADAVTAVHPGVHPTWSGRVPGHLGQHCWVTKEERKEVMRHDRVAATVRGKSHASKSTPETRPARATRAVPLPRVRPDFELEAALKEPHLAADIVGGRKLVDRFLPDPEPIGITFWRLGWR